MITIILGVIAMGSLFAAYEKLRNKRQGHRSRSYVAHADDAPRIIKLPENIEREKRRRHIR